MARFEVTGPDGARYQVEGPEGTTEQDAIAQVQKQIAAQPAPPQRSPAQAAEAPDKYTTGNPMGDQGGQGGSAMPEDPGISVRYLREQMAPEPGWVRSGVLPIATKEVSPGQGAASQGWKFDAVGPISSLLGPALDLLEGTGLETSVGGPNAPLAGKVSPEASMLLLGSRLGNPVAQFRNPLMPPGRDIRFGQPTMAESGPVLRREAPLSQEFQQAPIAPGARQKIAETPQGAPVSGEPVQAPAPSVAATPPDPWLINLNTSVQEVLKENGYTSLGAAATPTDAAGMTPAQIKANRRMIELRDVLEPPGLGEDLTIHVEGSHPTLAERAGDPAISQRENVVRQRNPNAFDPRLSENSQARIKKFDDMAGTDPQLTTLVERQSAQAKADTQKIMQTAKPADLQPAAAHIDELLNDPRIREVDDVVRVLKPLREKLFDADGNLKTDPMAVWGMHDNLMNLLAKAKDPLNATGAEKFAFEQMNQFKKTLDGVLNTATDGNFQTFLDNQAGFFQQRNAMEVLQKFRTQMVDAKTGHIYADKFHRWLTDLAVRRGKPGIDKAMDIPDDVMQGLIDINKDLKRASRIDLGKARGSPTNLYGEVAKAAGLAGVHALLGTATGGVGNVVMQLGAPQVRSWQLNRLTQRHLADPPGGFRPNPLMGP